MDCSSWYPLIPRKSQNGLPALRLHGAVPHEIDADVVQASNGKIEEQVYGHLPFKRCAGLVSHTTNYRFETRIVECHIRQTIRLVHNSYRHNAPPLVQALALNKLLTPCFED